MSDKPTVGTGKPMWKPKPGDKVELLGSKEFPRKVGTVGAVNEVDAMVWWPWEDHAHRHSVSALTWHNPEAT